MIRNALQRFMYGRYGNDQLNFCLLGLSLLFFLLHSLTRNGLFYWAGEIVIIWCLFRLLSRNLPKRRQENAKFMVKAGPVFQWFRLQRTIRKDKDHRYFKCPNCGQYLRAPKGRGKIEVTCQKCRKQFIKKV